MTTRLYYDTSALLKEFVPEVGSDIIDRIGTADLREGAFIPRFKPVRVFSLAHDKTLRVSSKG